MNSNSDKNHQGSGSLTAAAPVVGVGRFRKKPVVIEAIQFRRENWREVETFGAGAVKAVGNWERGELPLCVTIKTKEGTITGSPSDWIIKGTAGEFYPCKPEIFAEIYEQVSDETSVSPAAPAATAPTSGTS